LTRLPTEHDGSDRTYAQQSASFLSKAAKLGRFSPALWSD